MEFMRPAPRYDGHAQWYDEWRATYIADNAADIVGLLGPGSGLCLDLGCGTGLLFPALAGTGRIVVGLDMSADQLRFARRRSRQVIRADGSVLPFASAVFATVVASWISTDVNDFGAVLAEATRVLGPGGTFLFYGAHPCFNGPHIEWLDDGGVRAHPRYRDAGWHAVSPWWGFQVRRRVGMRHHPLAEVLNAFIAVGLVLDHVAETGPRAVPSTLAIRARKPLTLRTRPQARHRQDPPSRWWPSRPPRSRRGRRGRRPPSRPPPPRLPSRRTALGVVSRPPSPPCPLAADEMPVTRAATIF
jgi:SAM-dependent methyltransferase